MMPLINRMMLAVTGSMPASIVAKVTLTTALALVSVGLARRSRAAVRHILLAAAFAMLLLIPIGTLLAPPVRIAVAGPRESTPPSGAGRKAIATSPVAASPIPASLPAPATSSSALLLMAWIAGMAVCLLPVGFGLWQVRMVRRTASPWAQGQAAAEVLARAGGIERRVEVLLHGTLPGPMTCGVVRPAIVLPLDAPAWEDNDLHRALVHELEHVRRFDWITHCLARTVAAAYWFHPLVWMAWRRFSVEAERSCDDAVLRRSEPTAYADQLVALAKRLSVAAKPPLLAMANRADLATRVGAVLDSRQPRGRAGRLPVALACGAATILSLTISPLTIVAAPQANAPSARIDAATSMVITPVTVTDQNGMPLEGLHAEDFLVTEDGMAQKISLFEFHQAASDARGELSSYYIIGYYSPNDVQDGKFHKIDIIRRGDTTTRVRHRTGYYGLGARPAQPATPVMNAAVHGNTVPPRILTKKDPEYSDEARKAKYQGTVIVAVDLDAAGEIQNVTVVRSLGLGLDEKAKEAVRQWKFAPGTVDGKPAASRVEAAVTFRLL